MAEYIERETAIDSSNIITVQTREYNSIEVIPVDCIADLPAADVVEVVRCRECCNKTCDGNGKPYCLSLEMYLADDLNFFCSYGERRNNNA